MNRKTVCVVDYGVGNHTSVFRTFQSLGHCCRLTNDRNVLASADVLILPGVGAFPPAMSALREHGLDEYLCELVSKGKPLIGLCLGMQLLADESLEHGHTAGLGLIPGTVRPLKGMDWHIGWNSLGVVQQDSLMTPSDGESFYFNHSHVFEVPPRFQVAVSSMQGATFTVGVRCANVVGLQFHPEKSQEAGRQLLRRLVEGLGHA